MEDLLNGNLPIEKTLSPLEAISDQALYDAYRKVKLFESEEFDYDIRQIPEQVNSEVIAAVGTLLEEIVGDKVDGDTKQEEIDVLATDLGSRLSELEDNSFRERDMVFCTMVRVTLIAKILDNIEFVSENIKKNPKLLKTNYEGKYTGDLAYIWLTSLVNKRRQEK
jgi:hypothetical protein